MRKLTLGQRSAAGTASRVIENLHITEPEEIDIELIASHHRLLVRFDTLAHEDGQLIRSGNSGIVVVNEETRSSLRWRFVVAHELGHFLCHRDVNQLMVCTDPELHEWYATAGHEPEANSFAAELLMPERLFKPRCDVNQPSLHHVRALATSFNTSLTATALRFVDYCPEPVAVAFSVDGTIRWWLKSDDFRFWLRKGHRLGNQTYAGDLFAGKEVDDRPSAVSAEGWSEDGRAAEAEVSEHSMRLGKHGVLTILWHQLE